MIVWQVAISFTGVGAAVLAIRNAFLLWRLERRILDESLHSQDESEMIERFFEWPP
jgi:hypothetical protein